MDLSYWEIQHWFTNVDFTVVGSGIVGLSAALRLREKFPAAKILVLEKGTLPQGASTKNAGFACFGSLSEILDDLNFHSEEEVFGMVEKRYRGLTVLRNRLGDDAIDFRQYGGYELFEENDSHFSSYHEGLPRVNELLRSIFGSDVFLPASNNFGFNNIRSEIIYNPFEAQIDTGMMMQALLRKAVSEHILILNRQTVLSFTDVPQNVEVFLDGMSFKTKKLLIANNGFSATLTGQDVVPARAQVLVTSEIQDLKIRGTFHLDRGYYYFRNIGNRILLGGGRNLAFEEETTTTFGQTEIIQKRLETLLNEVILPRQSFTVDHRWSGIMGMGSKKYPIVRQLSDNTYCGVRLGGMGVAIGSLVGQELADLI